VIHAAVARLVHRNRPGPADESIPDARCAAVFGNSALDLISRGRCTPREILGKRTERFAHVSGLLSGPDGLAIKNAAAVGTDIDASEDPGITRDATKPRAKLMLVIVHSDP